MLHNTKGRGQFTPESLGILEHNNVIIYLLFRYLYALEGRVDLSNLIAEAVTCHPQPHNRRNTNAESDLNNLNF